MQMVWMVGVGGLTAGGGAWGVGAGDGRDAGEEQGVRRFVRDRRQQAMSRTRV